MFYERNEVRDESTNVYSSSMTDQLLVGKEGDLKIIVNGFEAFVNDNALDLFQSFCGIDSGRPKLEEYHVQRDNPLDWLLGTNVVPSSDQSGSSSWKSHQNGENGPICVTIRPPPKRDFWRKTFYEPVLIKDDAPFLYCAVPRDLHCTVTACFELQAASQFDQAGLMIRLSSQHWLKTGIELVDGIPLLSCVVTNTYSDWSTQPFIKDSTTIKKKVTSVATASGAATTVAENVVHVPECRIRVHCRGTSFVVQAVMDGVWRMIRIAHLSVHQQCRPDPLDKVACENGPSPGHHELWAGVFAACPVEQKGCSVTFTEFEIREGSDFDHSSEQTSSV